MDTKPTKTPEAEPELAPDQATQVKGGVRPGGSDIKRSGGDYK